MNNNCILVTGGSGFIGIYLMKKLVENGAKVINFDLAPPSPFTQILYSPPPDPSLFLLEPTRHAIYHFSLRNLAFQRQFLPENDLSSKPATAFTVDSVKLHIFLAIDNEVYYAAMP